MLWYVGEIASCDVQNRWRNKKYVNWNCNCKCLFYNVQHVSALIVGHNEARVRIFSKITITHNALLLNWLISQHYSMNEYFIDYGRNNKIKSQYILKYYTKSISDL